MYLPTSKQRVICFGNRLHGDDAFGCHVYDRLCEVRLPEDTTLYDGGTAGLSALVLFEACVRVIVVDAMAAGAGVAPGRLRWVAVDEIVDDVAGLSTHTDGLAYLLRALRCTTAAKGIPEVSVLTVSVGAVAAFTEVLSVQVEAAVPRAVSAVCAALERTHAGVDTGLRPY